MEGQASRCFVVPGRKYLTEDPARHRPQVVFTDTSIADEARALLEPTCDIRIAGAYASEDATIAVAREELEKY